MENASKALLMAGGVLIGLLILSLAVYLFVTFGADSKRINNQIELQQLAQYNAQYTIYEGRKDIKIYDIISVANLAKENNDYYQSYGEFATNYKVTVLLTGAGVNSTNNFQDISETKKQELLEAYSNINSSGELVNTFTCTGVEYHSNGRVKNISFKPTP